jgi:hypothetical protein
VSQRLSPPLLLLKPKRGKSLTPSLMSRFFGLLGMFLYPYLSHALLKTSEQIGLFLGDCHP